MLLEPIPDEQKHLAPVFYQEAERTFLNVVRIAGIVFGSSLIVFALTVAEQYRTLPETILLDVVNLLASVGIVVMSYRSLSLRTRYIFLLVSVVVVLLTNARESLLLQNYMSVFLMCLSVGILGTTIPWPPVWTVTMQGASILAGLSMFFYWEPSLVGPLATLVLVGIFSLFIHMLLTHQRWETFLNRHHIQSLNQELQRANDQLKVHSERLESELALARHIQQGLLPPAVPAWQGMDVVCYSRPAQEVGGDFYSYHTFAQGHVALAVGDVSGKGVAAALLMATGLSLFAATFNTAVSPAWRMAQLDEALAPYTRPRRQNCAMCYVELNTSTLMIVNAGCIPPYIRRAHDGTVDWPDVGGFALGYGLGARCGYQEVHLALSPGDLVVLTSDGMIEATNEAGDMFGFDRLMTAIAAAPMGGAQAMLDFLLMELARFVGSTPPHDDMTVVVFRVQA